MSRTKAYIARLKGAGLLAKVSGLSSKFLVNSVVIFVLVIFYDCSVCWKTVLSCCVQFDMLHLATPLPEITVFLHRTERHNALLKTNTKQGSE